MIRKKFFDTLVKSLTLSAFAIVLVGSPSRGEDSGSDLQTFSSSSYTYFNLCNKSSKVIFAAYASATAGRGLVSTGWTSIKPGQCKNKSVSGKNSDVFVYAEENSYGVKWKGNDASLCVHDTETFNYPNSDKMSCNAAGQKRVSMTRWSVSQKSPHTYDFR